MADPVISNPVVAACEKYWDAYKDDCSGFAGAVAGELGILLAGQANDIVDLMGTFWWHTLSDGAAANIHAILGYFVIGGLKKNPGNGHVVVVVPGEVNQGKYPTGYWGSLGGVGKKATTINWSWNATDRDKVKYAYYIFKPTGGPPAFKFR